MNAIAPSAEGTSTMGFEPSLRITALLDELNRGDAAAANQLLDLIYDELHALARVRMSAERPEHTLQPTALVHEAYLRLLGGNDQAWASRAHFFGAAAQAMRRILVEQARARHRAKRGGARHRTTLGDQLATVPTDPEQFLDLDRALTALEARDPAMAEVVRLRYFVGLTVPETAELLATSERSVNRLWTSARAWLLASLEPTASREDDLS